MVGPLPAAGVVFWFPWQVDDLMVGLWDIMGIYLMMVINGWFMGDIYNIIQL